MMRKQNIRARALAVALAATTLASCQKPEEENLVDVTYHADFDAPTDFWFAYFAQDSADPLNNKRYVDTIRGAKTYHRTAVSQFGKKGFSVSNMGASVPVRAYSESLGERWACESLTGACGR